MEQKKRKQEGKEGRRKEGWIVVRRKWNVKESPTRYYR